MTPSLAADVQLTLFGGLRRALVDGAVVGVVLTLQGYLLDHETLFIRAVLVVGLDLLGLIVPIDAGMGIRRDIIVIRLGSFVLLVVDSRPGIAARPHALDGCNQFHIVHHRRLRLLAVATGFPLHRLREGRGFCLLDGGPTEVGCPMLLSRG